jgi:8-oxo-dGTP diphosphatase
MPKNEKNEMSEQKNETKNEMKSESKNEAKSEMKKVMLPTVSAIIKNDAGEILFIRRSEGSKYGKGLLQLPGGRLEFGEQPIDALKREIKEELGCEFMPATGRVIAASIHTFEFGGMQIELVGIAYAGKINGEIHLSQEASEYKWIKMKDALKLQDLEELSRQLLIQAKGRR